MEKPDKPAKASKKLSVHQLDAKGDQFLAALRFAGWVPIVMLVVAVGASWLAADKAYKTIFLSRQLHASGASVRIVMEKTPMLDADYTTLAKSFARLHPKIKISVEKSGGAQTALRLKIDQPSDYADWIHALSVIHAQQPGVIWEVREMCLGRCANAAATALISGVRQTVTAKEQ